MTTKIKIIIASIAIITSFAIGRYTVSEVVRVETRVVEVEKKTEKTTTDKDTHKTTTTKEVTRPDGTKEKTTEVVEDTTSTTNKSSKEKSNTVSETSSETVRGSAKVTILGLAGIPITGGLPDFGVSVSRSILGPISISVGAFKSGLIFGGLGLTF